MAGQTEFEVKNEPCAADEESAHAWLRPRALPLNSRRLTLRCRGGWSRLLINLLIFFITFNSYSKCTETIEGTPTRPNPLSQHFIILMHS